MSQTLTETDDALLDDDTEALDALTAPDSEPLDDSADADIDATDDDGQPTTAAPPDGSGPEDASSAPAAQPFEFRAHGKATTLDGATYTPGVGLQIPDGPAFQRAQQLLARGVEMETFGRTRIRTLEVENQHLASDRTASEAHATTIIDWFNEMAQDPERLYQTVANWAQNKPVLDARIEKAKWEADKATWERRNATPEPTPQERYETMVTSARMAGDAHLQQFAQANQLAPTDVQAIAARLLRRPEFYVVHQNGQDLFDDVTFAQDVQAELQTRQGARQSAQTVQKAANANAAAKAGTIPAVVRAPKPSTTPTPPRDGRTGKFKSREEWEARMNLR